MRNFLLIFLENRIRGLLPFDSHDQNEILRNTLKADVPMDDEHWVNISPEGKGVFSLGTKDIF